MKTSYTIILVSVMAAVMLLTASQPCRAVEKDKENIWSDDEPGWGHRWFELTDEAIERIMNRLKESNPEKAKELAQLREKDPEKFKAELRKVMRERFRETRRERARQRGGPYLHTPPDTPRLPHMPREDMEKFRKHGKEFREHGKRFREHSKKFGKQSERFAEHLKWLEKNYPEKAGKLAELRKTRPELYMKKLGLSRKKYWRIAEAAEENPELAEALKEDLELKEKRDKLLRKIRAATDDGEKKELVEELKEVIGSRFNVIVKRKQIEYERMHKKLKKLEKRVKRSEAEVEKWKEAKFKKENVKARLGELVSETEKFKWD